MSEPRRECKLYPYQLAALEGFVRLPASLPVGRSMRTTAIVSLSSRSSPLWISHRK